MENANLEAERQRLNDLSGKVIGLWIEIHRELGPGLLESAYEECLAYELTKADFGSSASGPFQCVTRRSNSIAVTSWIL